ncbi:hypothetical protein AMJ71_08440 [candidate division TA06 bacterium SM1_40]|uniref:Uncharacterized protein n=1 Tax=candidate division TA06 bacterium SM1_40 TaxID=1703773 RepID=A0A0S8JIE4_UNCT6|nr:MAG: hypothetical protein AMJ71_08440 [candidate division TA06 bacterium SM1_40]
MYANSVVAIVVLSLFAVATSSMAAQRIVLGELFTNTSCGPCRPANLKLDTLAIEHSATLALIRYHTWWPSSADPFYQANIIENTARRIARACRASSKFTLMGAWGAIPAG